MGGTRGRLRIGTSGYQYEHWRGVFYPEKLPKKHWFAHYAEHFDAVEINNTFYRLPAANTFDTWRERAPQGFCYALKYSRYATHLKHLKDPHEPIKVFLDRASRLEEFCGPVLVQLPPNWKVDADRLADFLQAAPSRYRWAIEVRDPRWLCDEVYATLSSHNAALCIHDMLEGHPRHLTADWVYLRYHGGHGGGSYTSQALATQARYVKQYLADGLDVFAYFNNDARGHAVENAADLRRHVGGD
jgi:uncharacterized protein YecE (DUF72 family)